MFVYVSVDAVFIMNVSGGVVVYMS